MKVRSSLGKAKWTHTREEWYKKECEEILLKTKSRLFAEDKRIYLISDIKKELLLEIDNQKSKWFQIWLKIKDNN